MSHASHTCKEVERTGPGGTQQGRGEALEKTESVGWWKYATLFLQAWLKADWPATGRQQASAPVRLGPRLQEACFGADAAVLAGSSAGTYCACWRPVSVQMQRWCGP